MKTLPADLEALMPKPAFSPTKGILSGLHFFTADQVRELAVAVNERAATICDNMEDGAEFVGDTPAARIAEACAAAIRGAEKEGATGS